MKLFTPLEQGLRCPPPEEVRDSVRGSATRLQREWGTTARQKSGQAVHRGLPVLEAERQGADQAAEVDDSETIQGT